LLLGAFVCALLLGLLFRPPDRLDSDEEMAGPHSAPAAVASIPASLRGTEVGEGDATRSAARPERGPSAETPPDPEPDPPEEEVEELPEDPIELGDCGLYLRAVAAETHEPLRTHVWLYRLDAPANELYGRGDQLQTSFDLPEGGRWIERLPAGSYRAICGDQVQGASDPPAFGVAGPHTEVELRLRVPPVGRARLLLFDLHGAPVEVVEWYGCISTSWGSDVPHAGWVQARPFIVEGDLFYEETSCSGMADEIEQPTRRLEADPSGFDFGSVRAATRGGGGETRHELGWPAHNRVEVPVSWEGRGEPTRVAVLVPLGEIAGALWLDDGGRPDPSLLEIQATCLARRIDDLPQEAPWRAVSIGVSVSYPGHSSLSFEWTPGEGALADQFLPRATGSRSGDRW